MRSKLLLSFSIVLSLIVGCGIGTAIQSKDIYNNYDVFIDNEDYYCKEFYLENVNESLVHWRDGAYYCYNFFNLSVEDATTLNLVCCYVETTDLVGFDITHNLSIDGVSAKISPQESICGISNTDKWIIEQRHLLYPNGTGYQVLFNARCVSTVPFNITVILGYTVRK